MMQCTPINQCKMKIDANHGDLQCHKCDTRAGGNGGIRKWDCATLFTWWDVRRLKLLEDSAMVKGSEVW